MKVHWMDTFWTVRQMDSLTLICCEGKSLHTTSTVLKQAMIFLLLLEKPSDFISLGYIHKQNCYCIYFSKCLLWEKNPICLIIIGLKSQQCFMTLTYQRHIISINFAHWLKAFTVNEISLTVKFATLRTTVLQESKIQLKPTWVVKCLTFSNLFEGCSVMCLI